MSNNALTRKEHHEAIFGDPEVLDTICSHVANGGTVISLAKAWGVSASYVFNWLRKDKDRHQRYQAALIDRKEWLVERITKELHDLSTSDLRSLYDQNGVLKPITEWPDHVAVAVQSVETDELFDGRGPERQSIGVTRKLKFWDKNKSLEQLAKIHQLLVDKHEHTGQLTLGDLILNSYEQKKEDEPNRG